MCPYHLLDYGKSQIFTFIGVIEECGFPAVLPFARWILKGKECKCALTLEVTFSGYQVEQHQGAIVVRSSKERPVL